MRRRERVAQRLAGADEDHINRQHLPGAHEEIPRVAVKRRDAVAQK